MTEYRVSRLLFLLACAGVGLLAAENVVGIAVVGWDYVIAGALFAGFLWWWLKVAP